MLKIVPFVLCVVIGTVFLGAPTMAADSLVAQNLQCEYLSNPLGIDTVSPRLSWTLASSRREDMQTAYQIEVTSSREFLDRDNADLWNSGKVTSDETIQIAYKGKALASTQQCFWKVRSWDAAGNPSPWSEPATWTMGLLKPEDWAAKWITAGAVRTGPMPIFRKTFRIDSAIARATIFISGLGQFELHLNGEKVGDAVLEPGWTNYRKTILYVTYDLTKQLQSGENVLGVMLGNGMYNVARGRYTKFTGSFGPPMLIAQLHIQYQDGHSQTVATDGSWKTSDGPITFSSTYGGEDYDARAEQSGWDKAGFDDSKWMAATETTSPGGQLVASTRSALPIRVQQVLKAKAATQPKPGVLVYDLGQNCALMPQITVRGPAGSKVRITPGELLKNDGTVSQGSSGGPTYFEYTLNGQGDETWSSRFTYYGSRYFQIDGAQSADGADPTKPIILNVEGKFISSSAPDVGQFVCSNELFNRTNEMIRWAMRSNMMSILTDCPHREKLGWLEQDHLVGPSLMYNFAVPSLETKICGDMADSQTDTGLIPDIAPEYTVFPDGFRDSPEWGSAAVLVPWQLYQWYGDVEILRQRYSNMKRYVDYLRTMAKDNIVSYGLGDWYDLGPKPVGKAQLTPPALTATAFYFYDIHVLVQTAALIGNDQDAKTYAALGDDVHNAFNKNFYHADTHNYSSGSQTANAIPIVFGLAPEGDEPAIVENIVHDIRSHNNGLTSGDVGYRYLLRALANAGRSDVIFDMNSRSDRPGYGMILAKGATSLTEAWDARAGSSQDHFMLGHIMEWFYSDLAGIQCDPESVAFKNIRIKPTPVGDVTWAKASYNSVRGKISSEWKIANGKFILDVSIPPGATATVYLPTTDVKIEAGQPLAQATGVTTLSNTLSVIYKIGSGDYHFEAAAKLPATMP